MICAPRMNHTFLQGLQEMLERGTALHRVSTDGGYMEIDTLEDASLAASWWAGKAPS